VGLEVPALLSLFTSPGRAGYAFISQNRSVTTSATLILPEGGNEFSNEKVIISADGMYFNCGERN
jgi:hypothetical protein